MCSQSPHQCSQSPYYDKTCNVLYSFLVALVVVANLTRAYKTQSLDGRSMAVANNKTKTRHTRTPPRPPVPSPQLRPPGVAGKPRALERSSQGPSRGPWIFPVWSGKVTPGARFKHKAGTGARGTKGPGAARAPGHGPRPWALGLGPGSGLQGTSGKTGGPGSPPAVICGLGPESKARGVQNKSHPGHQANPGGIKRE